MDFGSGIGLGYGGEVRCETVAGGFRGVAVPGNDVRGETLFRKRVR